MSKLRYAGEVMITRLALGIVPFLPRRAVVGLANTLGWLAYRLSKKTRRVAMANIDVAFGDTLSPERKREIVGRSYKAFALVTLDIFWFSRRTKERLAQCVEVDESCWTAINMKPAVAVTGHFGNWEIIGQMVALHDPPFAAIAAPLANRAVDRLLNRLRGGLGQKIAYASGGIHSAVRALRSGGRVGLLLDQNVFPRHGGVFVKFFGLPVPMSAGAETLARKMNIPILFGFSRFAPGGHYVLYLRPWMGRADQDSTYGSVTQEIAAILEAEIRERPDHWLWMYKRWKYIPPGTPSAGYPFYGRPLEASQAHGGRMPAVPEAGVGVDARRKQ